MSRKASSFKDSGAKGNRISNFDDRNSPQKSKSKVKYFILKNFFLD